MELRDTVEGMLSADFRDRLAAETRQARIRLSKLDAALANCDMDCCATGCPFGMLAEQRDALKAYLDVLERRAVALGVVLE